MKIENLSKSLTFLTDSNWVIESEYNRIYAWNPDKTIFEAAAIKLIELNWKISNDGQDRTLVFYL